MVEDRKAREAIEQSESVAEAPGKFPPAGPHAQKDLIDKEKTPGSGAFADENSREVDAGSE